MKNIKLGLDEGQKFFYVTHGYIYEAQVCKVTKGNFYSYLCAELDADGKIPTLRNGVIKSKIFRFNDLHKNFYGRQKKYREAEDRLFTFDLNEALDFAEKYIKKATEQYNRFAGMAERQTPET